MPYQRELAVALEAAHLAGQAILELYTQFKAIPDAPASISTDADKKSQEIILEHLHRAFPEDALCAEETTNLLARVPQTGPRLWIVDPIDGTRGFARKNGEFSVMIGFLHDGKVAVGVVAEPALERLTFGMRGAGCHRQDGTASAVLCRVSQTTDLNQLTMIQSRSQRATTPSREMRALKPARIIETYSAGIKMAQVARGEADVYVNNYPKFHDWDICAGDVLVTEAGGIVTGLRGETLVYGLPGAPQTFGVLASNGAIHDGLVKALASEDN